MRNQQIIPNIPWVKAGESLQKSTENSMPPPNLPSFCLRSAGDATHQVLGLEITVDQRRLQPRPLEGGDVRGFPATRLDFRGRPLKWGQSL